jgi:hypothetical protein
MIASSSFECKLENAREETECNLPFGSQHKFANQMHRSEQYYSAYLIFFPQGRIRKWDSISEEFTVICKSKLSGPLSWRSKRHHQVSVGTISHLFIPRFSIKKRRKSFQLSPACKSTYVGYNQDLYEICIKLEPKTKSSPFFHVIQ